MCQRILSFDVGTKDLANFIVEFNETEFNVHSQELIDLADGRKTCEALLRTGRICKSNAAFSSSNKYLCKIHKEFYYPKTKKPTKNMEVICSFKKCNEVSTKILVKDLTQGWCDKHFHKEYNKLTKNVKAKRIARQSCNNIAPDILIKSIIDKLDERPDMLDVDIVLIENQPSLKNPTMKTVACFLYSYFTFRGVRNETNRVKYVKFIAPSGKLKVCQEKTNKALKRARDKEVYDVTKGLGELYCKALLPSKVWNVTNKHKKKDDLCDAFLQAFRYYYKDKTVPHKYIEMLEAVQIN